MGRASRRRHEARESNTGSERDEARRANRRARKAQCRVFRCGSRIEEWEALPDHQRVMNALISRHNKRMANTAALPPAAVEPVMSVLASIGYTDIALRELGADRDRPPSAIGSSWVDHLAWGVDSVFASARLLLSGQFPGGSILLRSQFERWAENAAYNMGIFHRDREPASSFVARAWASCHQDYPFTAPSMHADPEDVRDQAVPDLRDVSTGEKDEPVQVRLAEGHTAQPAELMDSMSELLHGRGPWMQLVHWEVGALLEAPAPEALEDCSQRLAEVMTLNFRQLRLCLATLAEERGLKQLDRKVLTSSLEFLPGLDVGPKPWSLYPLTPDSGLKPEFVELLARARQAHDALMRGKRPAGRLYQNDEFTRVHFYERRARATNFALKAFDEEKERMGKLDFAYLNLRSLRYLAASEISGLVSVWLAGTPASDAAAVCSSGLRSAFWLWLEDDDRALGAMRVVLEQCARMRVCRTKPEKAAKLDASPATAPKDWINSAGWRRLSALTKALGEFSHAHGKVRWEGAREILEKVADNDLEPEHATYLARGSALNAVAALLLSESVAAAQSVSPVIGARFAEIQSNLYMGDDALEGSLEKMFNRALVHKNADLGGYSFTGPAEVFRNRTGLEPAS